jgi:primosomal protein N'
MFPPYTRIIEIILRDRFEDRVSREASELAVRLVKSFDITGPYTPAVDKVADQYIRVIRINLKKDRNLSAHKKGIMEIVQDFDKSRRHDNPITINVDPA